jgi:ATP-dependent DNA helicase UvrD/PcrA
VDSLTRHDIPFEVANLGGLLSVPEVADMRAWLTIVERPDDSAALAQILVGSRYRLGLADLAALTRRKAGADHEQGMIDADDLVPVSLLEAIEDIDSIRGARPEALAAMRHFMGIYRGLLGQSQGMSLVEVARLALDLTGAWQDLESLPDNQRLTARLNLYRFLDLTEEWSPLRGRPSLGAFLDYLDAIQEEPAEELDSAHLSGEDAVTLVTVHRAKGLEWDVVAIPAVTQNSFPGRSQQFPDPYRFAEHLPASWRIDHTLAEIPEGDEDRKAYFRKRNELQEWRVAYVAATRARHTLIMTGAYWYGLPEPTVNAKKPSPLFTMVEQDPATVVDAHAEEGPRPLSLGSGPEARTPDPLFPDGWEAALRQATEDPGFVDTFAGDMGLTEPVAAVSEGWRRTLFELEALEKLRTAVEPDRVVSVTGLVTYAQCPKRFFWSDIDPLPRRRNPAAGAGTELHRRIELHQRGQAPFEEMTDQLYDVIEDEDRQRLGGGFDAFLNSKYAESKAALVEAPFSLRLENTYRVRGRIDAVYIDGHHWEVVDFKSGRPSADPARAVQLEAYALAATEVDFGYDKPERLEVSFVYLGGGLAVDTEHADPEWRHKAREHLDQLTESISAGEFEPTPGDSCRHCDFVRFCEAGRVFLESS